jgi:glycosyltransferase involved in cell wall biosynthesis
MRSFYSRELSETGGLLRYFLPYLRRAENKAVRLVDLVLANGEDTFAYAESCRGLDKKTVLVHNGVDTALFSPGSGDEMRRRQDWNGSVVFISNNPMRRIKGPQEAIAALARMPEDIRKRCRVVFFSKSEAMFRGFRELAQSLGVDEHVVALDHVKHEDLPMYLNAADVALHPVLFSAGTTHASLETLACGLPQISYNTASLHSTCIDGRTGILVPAGDVDGLARAMVAMATDADLRKWLGSAAREHSLAFDWQRYVARYVEALRELVGRS